MTLLQVFGGTVSATFLTCAVCVIYHPPLVPFSAQKDALDVAYPRLVRRRHLHLGDSLHHRRGRDLLEWGGRGLAGAAILLALLGPARASDKPAASHPAAAQPRDWHLLQRRDNGSVAEITGNLTEAECEFAQRRITGQPATPTEIAAAKLAQEDWRRAHANDLSINTRTVWETTSIVGTAGAGDSQVRHAECFQ